MKAMRPGDPTARVLWLMISTPGEKSGENVFKNNYWN
jgi:hypothetical protein